jgi:hypothetical protein
MKSPQYREGQGILEYFLLVVIAILLVFIISKLFGPAVSNWIQELMKNV